MKRIVKIQGQLQEEKFILQKKYMGFGIYQRITSNGFMVHQEWLITNGTVTVIFYSFTNYCEEELLDAIDNYNEIKKFGVRAMPHEGNMYVVHNNGTVTI